MNEEQILTIIAHMPRELRLDDFAALFASILATYEVDESDKIYVLSLVAQFPLTECRPAHRKS